MEITRSSKLNLQLMRLECLLDGLRSSVDGLRRELCILAMITIIGLSFLGFQLNRLEGRIDRIETAVAAIPAHLDEEFRAMRSEMAAQTSAIANSITATRQAQPPPPQIILVPEPRIGGQPAKP